MGLNSIR